MAKIICITTGLTGILNASFELVARLQQAGYEVCYASPKNVAEKSPDAMQKNLIVGLRFSPNSYRDDL